VKFNFGEKLKGL